MDVGVVVFGGGCPFSDLFSALSSFLVSSLFDWTIILASFISPFAFFCFPHPSRLDHFFVLEV